MTDDAMNLAPVVLFVYSRLWHTQRTIESLQNNALAAESTLYIYSDAPRNDKDAQGVAEIREYIKGIQGFKRVSVIERSENLGVDRSIIAGVTEVIERHGKIIVLEDDLESHPQFLEYMNHGLATYADNRNVISITGYSYTNEIYDDVLGEPYFLQLTNSWSWATWRDRWELLDSTAQGWQELCRNESLRKSFDYDDSYQYSKMLTTQMRKQVNTWDILWYWTAFKSDRLTLYPAKALVRNIGFDGSGVHCADLGNDAALSSTHMTFKFPESVLENGYIREQVSNVIRRKYRHTLPVKIKLKIKKLLIYKASLLQFFYK